MQNIVMARDPIFDYIHILGGARRLANPAGRHRSVRQRQRYM